MRTEPWQLNLAALWVGQTITMIAFSFVFPFFPLYVQTLGVQGTTEAAQWAGIIVAGAAISMSITQPIWGNLADRVGRRPMVIRSMVGASITVGAMGFVTSPEQLLVLRLLQGGVSGTVAAANALVATSTPKHSVGFALGLMQVALFVGSSVGPLIGGYIADTYGFRDAFYAAAVLMVLGAAIVFAFVREKFTPPPANVPRPGVWAESRALLTLSLFPLLIVVVFMIQFGVVIVSPVLSLFIAELSSGANAATAAGLVLAGSGAVSAISAIVLGRMSDRIGPARILPVCMAGAAITYIPQAFVHQVWELLALRVLLGVFLGGLMPSANALIAGIVPRDQRGAAFGLAATATALANAVGPLSAAGIVTHWDLRAVFLATGGLFALAFGWVMVGFRRHARPQQPAAASAVAVGTSSLRKDG